VELLSTDEALVACSHGDVIEEALDLLAAAGVPFEGRPRGAPQGAGSFLAETPKGAAWALDVRDGTIVKGVFLVPTA
jgi:hypothetical protein